jgi:hypothetical protein
VIGPDFSTASTLCDIYRLSSAERGEQRFHVVSEIDNDYFHPGCLNTSVHRDEYLRDILIPRHRGSDIKVFFISPMTFS